MEFMKNRYSSQCILDEWENADKTNRVIVLEVENPYLELEISGVQDDNISLCKEFLARITEFDNAVQERCKKAYYEKRNKVDIKQYMVALQWLSIKDNEVIMGYWGEYVNIELRVKVKYIEDEWKIIEMYYQ